MEEITVDKAEAHPVESQDLLYGVEGELRDLVHAVGIVKFRCVSMEGLEPLLVHNTICDLPDHALIPRGLTVFIPTNAERDLDPFKGVIRE